MIETKTTVSLRKHHWLIERGFLTADCQQVFRNALDLHEGAMDGTSSEVEAI